MSGEVSSPTGPRHLALKRWFLRTLVVSLTSCAVVAVVALLLGQFNDTTGRILLTLVALALHSGVAMICAAWIERRQWPGLSTIGLTVFGVNFVVLLTCVWWPGGLLDEPVVRAFFTTAGLLGYFTVAIPCADHYENRRHGLLPLIGLIADLVGLTMLLVCIWEEPTDDPTFPKLTGIVAVVAFSLAHVALLLRVPGSLTLKGVLYPTIAAIGGVAFLVAAAIWFDIDDDFYYRLLGALGVVDACGTLTLLILAKLRQVGKAAALETTPARLELCCPRCAARQTLDAGKVACGTCGLKITIEIEEPRCAKCGYLLWQLPDRRCPECGTTF